MTLEQLRAALREKHGLLKTAKEKALSAEASAEDKKAFDDLYAEIEGLEEQIQRAEKAEEMEARLSKIATAPVGPAAGSTVPATVKANDPAKVLALVGASLVKSKATGDRPMAILANEGYGGLVDSIMSDPRAKAVNTLVSSEGGVLVPAAQVGGGVIPLLRPQSTFLQADPVRIPLINGKFAQARGASGPTAAYVAEGAQKPVSTPTFDSISMASKKLAGIVPMTREAMMWTVGDLEAWVRAELQNSMAQTMDLNAWLGTGTGQSPLGVLNKAGVQTFTGVFGTATAPTLAELDTFANGMVLKLITANLYANGNWKWVMSYRTALRLSTMRTTNGDIAFPELEGFVQGQARWKGFPVVVSSQIPTNAGAGTDETTISLVDFSHVLFGEEEGITMRVSEQATIDTSGAGALVHLFQQNMIAVLAESMHDFGLRYAAAVVKASAIRF